MVLGANVWEDALGIFVGHLYYFLTVVHPQASGRQFLKTPLWVHQLVAKWQIGGPQAHRPAAPAAYQRGPNVPPAGVAPPQQGLAFRGRAYRLDRD
eukprot:jgi/Mesen1/9119/ME000058S08610